MPSDPKAKPDNPPEGFIISEDETLAVNTANVSSVRVLPDGGVLISAGNDAIHIPAGPQAQDILARFGFAPPAPNALPAQKKR